MTRLFCDEPACPVEARRKAMNEMREERIKSGAAPSYSANDYIETCERCRKTVGWKRDASGNETAIPQSVIWGRDAA
jgi:hypothetical protein